MHMNHSPYLLPVIIAGALYVFGQYVSGEPIRNQDHVITVQAEGKATSVPGIAHVTLGLQIEPQPTAQEATNLLGTQANTIIEAIKSIGIAQDDIQTKNVSVQPAYSYEDGNQELRGYEANEQIEVTVRKMGEDGSSEKLASEVIAKATEAGANQLGGVRFEDEESEVQLLAAERDAIANAQKKANELASMLNVRLGKIKNYTVTPNFDGPISYALEARGGDSVVPPPILPGTNDRSVIVHITYEIR